MSGQQWQNEMKPWSKWPSFLHVTHYKLTIYEHEVKLCVEKLMKRWPKVATGLVREIIQASLWISHFTSSYLISIKFGNWICRLRLCLNEAMRLAHRKWTAACHFVACYVERSESALIQTEENDNARGQYVFQHNWIIDKLHSKLLDKVSHWDEVICPHLPLKWRESIYFIFMYNCNVTLISEGFYNITA